MNFLRKNLSNIVFIGFIIFLFTPYGLPVRTTMIKGVSLISTRIFSMEIDKDEQVQIQNFDWRLISPEDQIINLKSMEDKVILVNFWATWCPPCIAEMPSFQDLYDDYGDKVEFLFVANDDPDRVTKFLRDKGYQLPVYFQATQAPKEMNSSSLPTTYIIDRNKNIVASKIGAADWNSSKVRGLLDKLVE